MGGMMSAIEAEQKELRVQERRKDILNIVSNISDFNDEEGKSDLAYCQKKWAKTYADAEAGDDESSATARPIVITQLPWEELESENDRNKLRTYCSELA